MKRAIRCTDGKVRIYKDYDKLSTTNKKFAVRKDDRRLLTNASLQTKFDFFEETKNKHQIKAMKERRINT